MSDVLSYGMNALQQAAEDYAKDKKERDKQEAAAIGNRGLYDKAVQAGVLSLEQQIEFNKGSASKKNEILAGAMRTWDMQRQQDQDAQRRQAFQLDQGRYEMEKARQNYVIPPEAQAALAASKKVAIPVAPGQNQIIDAPVVPPTKEELAKIDADAKQYGGGFVRQPDNTYAWHSIPTPQAKPPPTIRTPQGEVPLTSEIGQQRYQELNPDIAIHQKFGARPSDFMPGNVQVGGTDAFGKFDPKSDAQSHVQLKSTGAFMSTGDYTKYLRQLADAGQIDKPVQHPITGEWINPGKPEAEIGRPGPLDYTNPTHVALVQDAIKRNSGDVPAAMNELHQKGWY